MSRRDLWSVFLSIVSFFRGTKDKNNLVCYLIPLIRNSFLHTEFLNRLYGLEFGMAVVLKLLIRTFSLPWRVIWHDGPMKMLKHRQVRKKAFISAHLSFAWPFSLYLDCVFENMIFRTMKEELLFRSCAFYVVISFQNLESRILSAGNLASTFFSSRSPFLPFSSFVR